jgi:hypothetical protein
LNKTAQEAYVTELGTNIAAGGLLNVAVKEYSGKQLRVFFRPVSPLLTQSANALSCVLAKTPATTRKLTQAATYSVTTPGTWSYSATLSSGGTIPGGQRTATATGDLTVSTEGAEDVSCGTAAALRQRMPCQWLSQHKACRLLLISRTDVSLGQRQARMCMHAICTSALHGWPGLLHPGAF